MKRTGQLDVFGCASFDRTVVGFRLPGDVNRQQFGKWSWELEEMPHLEELYRRQRERPDVSILTINLDGMKGEDATLNRTKVHRLVKKSKWTLPVLLDERGDFSREFLSSPVILPTTVFVDRNAKIFRETGFKHGRGEFIASHEAMIDLARQGKLPEEQPRAPLKKSRVRIQLPPLEGEKRLEALAKLRTMLKKMSPEASDAEIEEQLEEAIVPPGEPLCEGSSLKSEGPSAEGGATKK